jgi:hypothetical protein
MQPFISPLDPAYISLKRAAASIAADHGDVEPDEVMDLLKYAVLNEEFEHPQIQIRVSNNPEAWNLPILRLEIPHRGYVRRRLAVEDEPQEYFAVKAATVAEVLLERDALPGTPEHWAAYAVFPRNPEISEDLHALLARIPYGSFPSKGQEILGDIRIARVKLRAWMTFKGYDLPDFLKKVTLPVRPGLRLVHDQAVEAAAEAPRGRPRKAAWPRIETLIREMHAADPATPRSVLAFDAHKQASAEFDEKDLPSLETVQRQVKSILESER